MTLCTECTYHGKHLDGKAENLPWPCVECDGGSHYIEKGKRPLVKPLRRVIVEQLDTIAELRAKLEAAEKANQEIANYNFECGRDKANWKQRAEAAEASRDEWKARCEKVEGVKRSFGWQCIEVIRKRADGCFNCKCNEWCATQDAQLFRRMKAAGGE